jgi:hypothetical protein
MSSHPILQGSAQGHRRLRFSFFLHLSKSKSLTPETPKNPIRPTGLLNSRSSPQGPRAGRQSVAAVDEDVFSETQIQRQQQIQTKSENCEALVSKSRQQA